MMTKCNYIEAVPCRPDSHMELSQRDPFNTTDRTSFTKTVSYVNGTNREVCVIDRDNNIVNVGVHNRLTESQGYFVIRTVYRFPTMDELICSIRRMKSVRQANGVFNTRNLEFCRILENAVDSRVTSGFVAVTLVDRIAATEFRSKGAVYHSSSDSVVHYHEHNEVCLHPYSTEHATRLSNGYINEKEETERQSIHCIQVVDNEGITNKRFIYSLKQILTVQSQTSSTKDSGVYVSTRQPTESGVMTDGVAFYTFEEAKEAIGLYETIAEARTNGDPTKELLTKKSEAAARIEELKNEAKEKEIVWGTEKAKRDLEMEDLRQQLKKSEMLYEERTRVHTEKSNIRKENHDSESNVLKVVGSAVAAILTIVVATLGIVKWLF